MFPKSKQKRNKQKRRRECRGYSKNNSNQVPSSPNTRLDTGSIISSFLRTHLTKQLTARFCAPHKRKKKMKRLLTHSHSVSSLSLLCWSKRSELNLIDIEQDFDQTETWTGLPGNERSNQSGPGFTKISRILCGRT